MVNINSIYRVKHLSRGVFLFTFTHEQTFSILSIRRGTSVRKTLEKSIKYGDVLDMMYLAKDGSISKRRVSVLQVGDVSFRAYCHLRKSKRTFTIDNVLALVPVIQKERMII